MAESYRGLTIRIGGDTTKLTQALKAANQAVAGTASDLRRLSAAMKLDPGNFEAATLQVGALASQASNTAAKIVQLRTAMQQTGELQFRDIDGQVKSVEEMADAFRDVRMEAALAMDAYNEVTTSIAEVDHEVTSLVQNAVKLRSVDLKSALTFDRTSLETAGLDIEKIRQAFSALPAYVKVSEDEISSYIAKMVELKKQFDEATRVSDKNSILKEMNELGKTMASFEMPVFNFEDNTNEVDNIREALEQLANDDTLDESMRMSQEQIDATCARLDALKQTWVEAQARMEVTKTVAQFVDLRSETVKTEASMSAFLDELVKASSTSTVAKGLGETNKQIAELDERYKSAKESIKSINEALKSDPANVELLAAKSRAVADAQELAAQKAALLKQKIDAYQSDKVRQLATDTKELASQITITTQNFKNSASSLSTYEAMIAAVTQRINQLKGSNKTDTSEYKDLINQLELLQDAAERARDALKSAIDEMQEPLEANEVRSLTADLQTLESEAKNLGNIDPPKIDDAAFMQSVNMIANAMKRLSGEIISSSDTIDSAYRDMRKTVNGTEEEFQSLLDSAIKFSQTSITSADTMLEMQALGGQLGVVTKDLEKFGQITSSLDIATDMNAEDIALRLGQVANVLSLDIDGMQGFSDALVRLGNNMPAQESAIMNVAQRLSAVASTANFSGSEILAWSAAIASTGQRSEAAATAIGNTISGIESAVAEGGDSIAAFATIAGRSAEDFTKTWKANPTEALREFLNGLQTIGSSGESAVAALENMGITGVRQQQTLLGLSKTVDSLDKALAISSDAWNQVSDEWGQAGDAANEAAKKSAGFSGALAIMQNNASNLAASLGEGFIPIMNAASEVMKLITDALNQLPAPMKTAIVSIGGLATVIGTVVPVIAQFSKGWAAAAQALVNSGGSIGAVVTKLTGLTATVEGAAASVSGLSIAATACGTVGIAALIGAVGVGITMLMDFYEEQVMLSDATTGLENAMNSASVAFSTYSAETQGAVERSDELLTSVDNLIQKQAELAGSLSDSWSDIGTNEAIVDSYVQKMAELSDSSSLTKDQMGELAAAVEGFNEMTGASVSIIDSQTGSLSMSASQIQAYADAWAEAERYAQALTDSQDITQRLTENTAALNNVQAEMQNQNMGVASTSMDAAWGMNELSSSVDTLRSAIASDNAALSNATAVIGPMQSRIVDLQNSIVASGQTLEAYANVTAQQWAFIASAYGSNVAVAIAELNKLSSAQGSALAGAKISSPSIPVSTGGSDSAAKKALQRANDAAYKAQQKAYDAEYKAQQKAYDKEYKALQKQLNKKYEAEKKSLDAIYKERKKQYDAQLKALKDAQDDEVDAFNKATNAKLKEMEREYKARVKLLEQQYGTDAIDDQIEALEAETEAEKRALEERQEQDKVAELQAAVDKAKSRRKRAEAEKELNDYLEKIQVKHNEQTRKDQIEALKKQKEDLKDELDSRKEDLKAQYDAEVEAYKQSRADQLDAMKEANAVEYETAKERYDALLEQLKERNSEQLEALKEAQTEQLESLKESQQASLESMKEAQQESLQAMKDAQQDALDSISSSGGAVVSALDTAESEAVANTDKHVDEFNTSMGEMASVADEKSDKAGSSIATNLEKPLPRVNTAGMGYYQNIMDPLDRLTIDSKKVGEGTADAVTGGLARRAPVTVSTAAGVVKSVDTEFSSLERSADTHSTKAASNLDSGLQSQNGSILSGFGTFMSNMNDVLIRGGNDLSATAGNISSNVEDQFSNMGNGNEYTWGSHLIANLNNGMVNAWNNTLFPNIQSMANTIEQWLGHSVPDKGPLKDDDKWGGDFVMNLVNGMHDKESDLYKQVKRMSEIVEDGFDPDMTLDAAYEAVNGIRSGRARQQQSAAQSTAPVINMSINLNMSGINMRSDQDIDRQVDEISKRLAAAAARELAGRL